MHPSRALSALQSLLDFAYPQKCALCNELGEGSLCNACAKEMPRIDSGIVRDVPTNALDWHSGVFHYEDRAKQAVTRLKFNRSTALAKPMSAILAERARKLALETADVILPVPIHWRRYCHRGFNQALYLCQEFQKSKVRTDLLYRIRATRPQVGLSIEQRRINLKGAFWASPDVANLDVLLVDDVFTSGGTAEECAKTLKRNGASSVGLLAFASGRDRD